MADLTSAEVRGRFPQFASLGDPVVERIIIEAYSFSDVSETATLYCIAHMLQLELDEEAGVERSGEVEKDKVGPVASTYKVHAETSRDVYLTQTKYGQRCLAEERRTPAGVVAIRYG